MRLAADGRGAQTVEINDKFAHFNESLSIAQEAAREAISARAREREAAARREKEVTHRIERHLCYNRFYVLILR
jgi:SNW domain-containing protein 1